MSVKAFLNKHKLAVLTVIIYVTGMVNYAISAYGRYVADTYSYYNSFEHIAGRPLYYAIILIITAIALWIAASRASLKICIKSAIPVFCIVLLIAVFSLVINDIHPEYIHLFYCTLYTPSFFCLSLMALAYQASKYKTITFEQMLLSGFLFIGIPVILSMGGFHSVSTGMVLFITAVILSLRLAKDGKTSKYWPAIIGITIAIAAGIIVFTYFHVPLTSARIAAILSGGQSDPYGIGWDNVQIRKALGAIRFIGVSDLTINSKPAYAFFSSTFWNADLLVWGLIGGWVLILAIIAMEVVLIVMLFKRSNAANNSFGKYFLFSVSSMFAVKTGLTVLVNFFAPLAHITLPFYGEFSWWLMDIILLVLSLGVSAKSAETAGGLIDKDNTYNSLIFLPSQLKEKYREICMADIDDEDYFDDLGDGAEVFSRENFLAKLKLRKSLEEPGMDEVVTSIFNEEPTVSSLNNPLKPYDGTGPFIFISYAHRNKTSVMPIIAKLNEENFNVWYDEGVDPGTEWPEIIAQHVENCSYFIACLSPEFIQSENCKDELNYARDLDNIRLIVYLSPTELPSGMKMRLNRLQAIYKYTYDSDEQFYDKLLHAKDIDICKRY